MRGSKGVRVASTHNGRVFRCFGLGGGEERITSAAALPTATATAAAAAAAVIHHRAAVSYLFVAPSHNPKAHGAGAACAQDL